MYVKYQSKYVPSSILLSFFIALPLSVVMKSFLLLPVNIIYHSLARSLDPSAPDVGGTNDTALLKLQLAAALRREQLAMQALSHVRQLSDQLSESLAREARLADEITSLHQLIHERGLGVGAQNFEAEKVWRGFRE